MPRDNPAEWSQWWEKGLHVAYSTRSRQTPYITWQHEITSLMLNNWYNRRGRYVQCCVFETQWLFSSLYIQEIYFTLHSPDLNSIRNSYIFKTASLRPRSKYWYPLVFFYASLSFFVLCSVHCSELWSSPASSPVAILTRTAVGMMYFLFTSVAATYNF